MMIKFKGDVLVEVVWNDDKLSTYKANGNEFGEYRSDAIFFETLDGTLVDINKKFVKSIEISELKEDL